MTGGIVLISVDRADYQREPDLVGYAGSGAFREIWVLSGRLAGRPVAYQAQEDSL